MLGLFPRRIIILLRFAIVLLVLAWAGYGVLLIVQTPSSLSAALSLPTQLVLAPLVLGWIPVLLTYIMLRVYVRRVRRMVKAMDYLICPRCGYDLRGCDSFGACPECGREYVRDKLPIDWHRGGFAPRDVFWKMYRRRG